MSVFLEWTDRSVNRFNGLDADWFFVAPAYDFWLARQRYEYKYKLAGSLTAITALLASLCAVMIVLHMNAKELSDVANGRLYASNIVSYIVYGILWFIIILEGKHFSIRNIGNSPYD